MVLLLRVEGNIGCGKSTLLHHLAERLKGARVVPEPVEGWTEHIQGVYGKLNEASDWKLPMQALSACTRAESLFGAVRRSRADEVVVVERSGRSAAIFGTLTLANDSERQAFELLSERYERIFQSTYGFKVTEKSVYLQADPQTCARRIQVRGRLGENGIDREFLGKLHAEHESAFATSADLVVNCDTVSSDDVAAEVMNFVDVSRRE